MIYQLLSNETCGFVFQQSPEQTETCSVISVGAVLYFTKCGMVWCGAYI